MCIGRRQDTRQPHGNAYGQPVNNNIRRHADRDTVSRLEEVEHVGRDDTNNSGLRTTEGAG